MISSRKIRDVARGSVYWLLQTQIPIINNFIYVFSKCNVTIHENALTVQITHKQLWYQATISKLKTLEQAFCCVWYLTKIPYIAPSDIFMLNIANVIFVFLAFLQSKTVVKSKFRLRCVVVTTKFLSKYASTSMSRYKDQNI